MSHSREPWYSPTLLLEGHVDVMQGFRISNDNHPEDFALVPIYSGDRLVLIAVDNGVGTEETLANADRVCAAINANARVETKFLSTWAMGPIKTPGNQWPERISSTSVRVSAAADILRQIAKIEGPVSTMAANALRALGVTS